MNICSMDNSCSDAVTVLPLQSPEGASLLSGLETGTTYQVMVCTPDFNTSDLPLTGDNPFIPECGYCIRCFMTEQPYFKFDETYVMRLNSTYVELICEVESNVNEFSITWSVAVEEGRERMVISNGDVIEGKLFLVDIASSTPGSVTSTLIAPDIVLDQDVQCMAMSEFASRSSEEGAFFEGRIILQLFAIGYTVIEFVVLFSAAGRRG